MSQLLTLLRSHRFGLLGGDLCMRLEISRATLHRHIRNLRDAGYPIEFDNETGKYRLDEQAARIGPREEMPGLWIDSSEAYALLTLFNVMQRIDPGFLSAYIEPLRGLLKNLLSRYHFRTASLDRKVAVDFGQVGRVRTVLFQRVSRGLLEDRQLRLTFSMEGKDVTRTVSPQRIVLTPTGWKLDVLDHGTDAVHTIDMLSIRTATVLEQSAVHHPAFDVRTSPPGGSGDLFDRS